MSKKTEISLDRYFIQDSLFDHETEHVFYQILKDEILGSRYVAFIQIPLSSIIGVKSRNADGWMGHFGKIARKRVDFVLCQKSDLKPLLAIELDGSSHQKNPGRSVTNLLRICFQRLGFRWSGLM